MIPLRISQFLLVTSLLFQFSFCHQYFTFEVPKDWQTVSTKNFSKNVKIGCLSPSKKLIKPSLNLATEKSKVSLKEYITAVKKIYLSDRCKSYSSLGYLESKTGEGHLALIETKKPQGDLKTLQYILKKEDFFYIITGVCEATDYLENLNLFQKSFKTLQFFKTPWDLLNNDETNRLKTLFEPVEKAFIEASSFHDKKFQKNYWIPFEKSLTDLAPSLGIIWPLQAATYYKNSLCNSTN